jgi:hypothetical protein
MHILIPTYARAQTQTTFNNLPPELQARAKLVVQKREVAEYAKGAPLVVLPPGITTISETRQWIMTKWSQRPENVGDTYLVMLDDDLRWDTRRTDDPTKFLKATPKDIAKAFRAIENLLAKGYAHVGVSGREGANRDTDPVRYTTRMSRVLAYNVEVFLAEKIKFDRVVLQEDFDVTLQLLRKGYSNAIVNTHVQGQGGSNTAGGCSTYRTMELQASAAERLATLHPEFVKVVTKQTKASWGGEARQDVVVQWQKAFKSAA